MPHGKKVKEKLVRREFYPGWIKVENTTHILYMQGKIFRYLKSFSAR
jgi:hypothetical protein